jgi:hypothetical protein
VSTYSETEWAALAETESDLSLDARDRSLLVAVIDRAAYTAGAITQGDITSPPVLSDQALLTVSQPLNITGVTIVSVDPLTFSSTSLLDGLLSYAAVFPPTLSWQEPGDTPGATQPIVATGQLTLPSGTTGRSIVVEIEQTMLPAGSVSDIITVEEVYPDPDEVPSRASARDGRHRDFSALIPTDNNPHGLSSADLVDVVSGIMGVPATLSLGRGLNNSDAARLIPRIISPYQGSGRTLLFENIGDAPPTSPLFGIGSFRIYGNGSSGVELVMNAAWDGTNWNTDFFGPPAFRIVFQATTGAGDLVVYRRSPAAPVVFTDAEWDTFGTSTDGGTRRSLLWESGLGSAGLGSRMRVYRVVITGPGLPVLADVTEITINARWDHAGPDLWEEDSGSADSIKILLGPANVSIYYHDRGSGSAWPDVHPGGWDNLPLDIQPSFDQMFLSDQRLDWVNTTTGTAGANPPIAQPQRNRLVAKNIVKAWGLVTTGGISPVAGPGFNIGAYGYSGDYLEVTFPAGGEMDSINYIVLPIINQDTSQFCTVVGAGKSSSQFRIAVYNGVTGARETLSAVTTTIAFAVLGQQIS